jgi:hypothetical protein
MKITADLSRFKYYRNIIVHCNDALVDDTDFESYWNDVTPVIHNYITDFSKDISLVLCQSLLTRVVLLKIIP